MNIRRHAALSRAMRPLLVASLATSALVFASPMPGDSVVSARSARSGEVPSTATLTASERSAGASSRAAARAAPTRAHPYSDPEWYPLRTSSLSSLRQPPSRPSSSVIGCVRTNCPHPDGGHSYWAVDFIADRGDPVFAAGGGILRIGRINFGCTTSGPREGTYLWVDHGGGVVSRYHHLSSVANSRVGEFVGPRTKIGEVGKSGSRCGSTANYLHFEVRRSGVKGPRTRFAQLRACRVSDGARILLPQAMGYSSWDDVPFRDDAVPRTSSSCVGTPWARTPDRPSLNARPGPSRARLSWSNPSKPAGRLALESAIFRPSSGRWSKGAVSYLPDSARSTVIRGLSNGRQYRYRIAYGNKQGYSRWSAHDRVVPAGLPSQPQVRRIAATRSRIGYGWSRSDGNGRDLRPYLLSIRRRTSSGWTEWAYTPHPADSTSYNWYNVRPYRTYEVRVKGRTVIGSSPWSEVRRIRTEPS